MPADTPDGHEPDEFCWCEPDVVMWEPLLLVHNTDQEPSR